MSSNDTTPPPQAATNSKNNNKSDEILALEHPDTEAAVPKDLHVILLQRVPQCLACFQPGNADAWSEPLFADFPRTLDAMRWSFGMAQALRVDVVPERMAEFKATFEAELVALFARISDMVNAPKCLLDLNLSAAVSQDTTACCPYIDTAIVAARDGLIAQEARVAMLRTELHRQTRNGNEMMLDLAKLRRAKRTASLLHEAASVAVRDGRTALDLLRGVDADDAEAQEAEEEPSSAKRARCC